MRRQNKFKTKKFIIDFASIKQWLASSVACRVLPMMVVDRCALLKPDNFCSSFALSGS